MRLSVEGLNWVNSPPHFYAPLLLFNCPSRLRASGFSLHAPPHRDETEEFLDESYRACQATAARPDAALHCSDGEVGSDSESESVLPASSCNRACVRVRVACVPPPLLAGMCVFDRQSALKRTKKARSTPCQFASRERNDLCFIRLVIIHF